MPIKKSGLRGAGECPAWQRSSRDPAALVDGCHHDSHSGPHAAHRRPYGPRRALPCRKSAKPASPCPTEPHRKPHKARQWARRAWGAVEGGAACRALFWRLGVCPRAQRAIPPPVPPWGALDRPPQCCRTLALQSFCRVKQEKGRPSDQGGRQIPLIQRPAQDWNLCERPISRGEWCCWPGTLRRHLQQPLKQLRLCRPWQRRPPPCPAWQHSMHPLQPFRASP